MTTTEKRETVVSNETRTVVFQNVTSGIVIEKLDRVTSAPLPNARFQVTRNSDNIVIGEYVTDEDGLALVGGLTPGMYTVEELAAPTGYEMDAPSQLVHVKDSEFAHATFTDTLMPASPSTRWISPTSPWLAWSSRYGGRTASSSIPGPPTTRASSRLIS